MAHFLITSDIEKRQPYLSYLSEYGDEEPETRPGCPKCHFHKYDYSFLSRLGSPWLAHKSQLKFHLQRSSPLELACYLSTENFDESKIGLLSDSENLLERSFFFYFTKVFSPGKLGKLLESNPGPLGHEPTLLTTGPPP